MKSYIVKLNETGKYFQVGYFLTDIISMSFTKKKKNATIFEKFSEDNIAGKLSVSKMRNQEFSYFLYSKGLKPNDITLEEIDTPAQPLFSKKQLKEIKQESKILKKHGCE